MVQIADICKTYKKESSIFSKLIDRFSKKISVMKFLIEYVVDFDTSKMQRNFTVNIGIDYLLDKCEYLLLCIYYAFDTI